MSETTTAHDQALLGLEQNWKVTSADFLPEKMMVDIRTQFCGKSVPCSKCKTLRSQADMAPEQTWRHLETMQFVTQIHASVP